MDLNKKIAREMRKEKDKQFNEMLEAIKKNDPAYRYMCGVERLDGIQHEDVFEPMLDYELTKLLSLELISPVQYEKLRKMARAEDEMRTLAKSTINNLRDKRIKIKNK